MQGCGPAALAVAVERGAARAGRQASVGGAEAAGGEGLCEPPPQGCGGSPGAWQEEAERTHGYPWAKKGSWGTWKSASPGLGDHRRRPRKPEDARIVPVQPPHL